MTNIIAHRGLSAIAPENTMNSFQPMTEYNLQWFETDVTITADAQPVILHDATLNRTTNLEGDVSSKPYHVIEQADAGSWFSPRFAHANILTLDDLVDFVNQTHLNLNLELKGISGPKGSLLAENLIKKLVPALAKIDDQVQILISSFNPVMLLNMHQAAPNYDYAVLYDHDTFTNDWQLIADACGAKYIHIDQCDATPENIQNIHDRGFKVNVYTVNSQADIERLEQAGVDGIFTDIANQLVPQK